VLKKFVELKQVRIFEISITTKTNNYEKDQTTI